MLEVDAEVPGVDVQPWVGLHVLGGGEVRVVVWYVGTPNIHHKNVVHTNLCPDEIFLVNKDID